MRGGRDTESVCVHMRVMSAREHDALPIVALRRRLGLTRHALDLVFAVAAPSLDAALGRELRARWTGEHPTCEELVSLLPSAVAAAELASLVATGLVEIVDGTVRVDDRVLGFLRGSRAIDRRLRDSVELHDLAPPTLDPEAVAVVLRELASPSPIIVEGPALVGKTSVVVAAVAARGRATLVADLARIDPELLRIVEREARLQGAMLVLRAAEWGSLSAIVQERALVLVQRGVAILTTRDGTEVAHALRGSRRIRIAMPPVALRQRIWNAVLESDLATFDLCVRHPLAPGDIAHAAATAREVATREHRPITIHDLERAARDRSVEPKQPATHDRRPMTSKLIPLATSLFTVLVASTAALADKQTDLAFEIKERHSYTQSLVLSELMTIQVGAKCWDTLLDKKQALQARIASTAHVIAKYGSAASGGDDWRKIENQSNSTKDKNRTLVAARVAELKPKFHITVKVEGDDCDGQQPLWANYLGHTARALEACPPKSGKVFVTINVLAKAKGVKAETKDGTTFTITGARDIEETAWGEQIDKVFKRASNKG